MTLTPKSISSLRALALSDQDIPARTSALFENRGLACRTGAPPTRKACVAMRITDVGRLELSKAVQKGNVA